MTKKNKHISEKDFQRYLGNQMTDAERNAFERELQKHPFEAEALEGFQQISPEELSGDLLELKTRLFSEKRKSSYRYWAAAATLLLLVTSGILWYQLKDKNPIPAVTENEIVPKTEEKAAPTEEEMAAKTPPEKETPVQILTAPEKAESEESEIKAEPGPEQKAASTEPESKAAKTPPAPQTKSLNIVENQDQIHNDLEIITPTENNIADMKFQDMKEAPNKFGNINPLGNPVILGKALSADSLHFPGLIASGKMVKAITVSNVNENEMGKSFDSAKTRTNSISEIKFNQMQPTTDTNQFFGAKPISPTQEEMTVRGYGKPEINKTVSSAIRVESNARVWPAGGMEEYEKYLEEKAVLPDDFKHNREVVKIVVNFDKFGDITGFTNKNNADSTVFEMAKDIIKNGPKWSPEIRNRMPVNSEKELKIVFRKRK